MIAQRKYNVITDGEAANMILQTSGAFVPWLGAGVSIEAGIPGAEEICLQLANALLAKEIKGRESRGESASSLKNKQGRLRWLNQALDWSYKPQRYLNCVRLTLRSPAARVDFFRQLVKGKQPSFAHSATAILMSHGVLARTCLTTNFDKLLEKAFEALRASECQAIRIPEEVNFLREEPDRCYCLKLHGDYDTHNIMNTDAETIVMDDVIAAKARQVLSNRGLLVLGLAGFEKSTNKLIESFNEHHTTAAGVREHGILWGVYAGNSRPNSLTQEKAEELVEKALREEKISPDVKLFMQNEVGSQIPHAFFPFWGSGSFMWELINRHGDPALRHMAEPYLDHTQRIQEVFRKKGLSIRAREKHLGRLNKAREVLTALTSQESAFDRAFSMSPQGEEGTISIVYGNLAATPLLSAVKNHKGIRAVVSPEDTCLSIGGGAALALAQAAGIQQTLHEVSKFAPIPHGTSIVTSGGKLPVSYIFHAASVEIKARGPEVSSATIKGAMEDVLKKSKALSVTNLFVPLLAAGVAGMTPQKSLQCMTKTLANHQEITTKMNIAIVIYREAILNRATAKRILVDTYEQENLTLE